MNDPKDIFKKFGQSARHILITSQRIAQNMHSGIGTEHFLLALTVTAGNIAYDILKENAINLDQVKLIISINNIKTNLTTGLSKEAKEILSVAAKKAEELNHNSIESEHLLWAITATKECRAYQVISRIGVDCEEISDQLEEIFTEVSSVDSFLGNDFNQINFGHLGNPSGFELVMPHLKNTETAGGQKTSKTPMLDQFGTDLTKMAKNKQLDELIGRKQELVRTIQILCRRTKNNPVLVGEPGIGKTAIVEGLAQKIINNDVPRQLAGKRLINLDLSMAVAGTMYRGQFEDRIKKIIQEVIKSKNIILFIDEIHTVIGAGSAEGSIDAANILKPSLSRGQINLIGATTIDEYTKHIEKDKALERRLQIVKVNEPTVEETIKILEGIKKNYENYHNVVISDAAIVCATQLSKRYIADRFLPDKAIDLIDEASAAKQINSAVSNVQNKGIIKLKKQLELIKNKKDDAAHKQDYEKAAILKYSEIKIQAKINKEEHKHHQSQKPIFVLPEDIAAVVSLWTGIPIENLIQSQQKKFLNLESNLKKHIIGQDQAIKSIVHAIKRSKSHIANPDRPIGTFLFLGPTGVGKTELTKKIAKEVYAKEDALVKLDMSEFMEKHNVSRLVGAPPGYIGYEDSGKLTEKIRRNPYSVVLFDEIEKAHPEVFNILLQILEDGYLTDAKGRLVNFRNTIIILTSNIGVNQLNQQAAIGFETNKTNNNDEYKRIEKIVLDQLKKEFKPEFLNRLDEIIVFKPLNKSDIRQIVNLQITNLVKRLGKQNIRLSIANEINEYIARVSYEPKYGAREIRRKIAKLIENPLADLLLIAHPAKIKINLKNKKINFHKISR